MNTCHSLNPMDSDSEFANLIFQEKPLSSAWNGRRVVAIKECDPIKKSKLTPDEELLQKLLRRSILNLPDGPFQPLL